MANILIVGAGPTGLTMAAVLARYGLKPRIIDRAVQPPDDRSRAIVIQARTLELFEDLGIVQKVLDAGLVVDAANVFTPGGRRGTVRFRPEWIDSTYGRLVTLPQEETERILGELVASSRIAVERGVELTAIEGNVETPIAVLKHHDGRIERMAAGWILGCDGAHSTVRRLAGLPFHGDTYPDECLLGDVEMEWGLPEGQVSICPHTEGVLLAFPLPGVHRFRVVMIIPSTKDVEERHLEEEEFLAQLRRMTPAIPGAPEPRVVAARWLTRYRLHRRGVSAYRRGRSFVAGDAAHIHSPVGAQGMNTGIQDAYNLGWKLALVTGGLAPSWLLDTYDAERRRVGEFLLRNTDRMFAIVAGGGRLGRAVRRIMPTMAVRLLSAPVVGKRLARFVSQTGIRYRGSPLSTEAHGAARLARHSPRAGDRAPDVAIGSGRRLFGLLRGPQHTLLLFANNSPALIERFSALGAEVSMRYGALVRPVILRLPQAQPPVGEVDEDGEAHDRYGANPGALYLVRPDKYIGFRGAETDTEVLRATLRARFLVPETSRR